MPTIRHLELRDGREVWRAVVRRRGHPHLSQTFDSEPQARVWAENLEAEIRLGRHTPALEGGRKTVAEAIERYCREVLPGLSPTNQATERQRLRWWSQRIGVRQLRQVTPGLVLECRGGLVTDGRCSPATANRYIASLSAVLTRCASEWQWVAANPCRSVRGLPEPRGRVRYLSPEEVRSLLAACRVSRNRLVLPLVTLALATGARRGELLALTWGDVDLSAGTIALRETKNGRPRTVPLAPEALHQLRELARVRRIDTGLVFPGARGRGYQVRRAFEVACRKAGITDFRWHDIRHTACSHLVMSGVPVVTVAAIVGHRTLEMTLRYAHLSVDSLRPAVAKLEEALEMGNCAQSVLNSST